MKYRVLFAVVAVVAAAMLASNAVALDFLGGGGMQKDGAAQKCGAAQKSDCAQKSNGCAQKSDGCAQKSDCCAQKSDCGVAQKGGLFSRHRMGVAQKSCCEPACGAPCQKYSPAQKCGPMQKDCGVAQKDCGVAQKDCGVAQKGGLFSRHRLGVAQKSCCEPACGAPCQKYAPAQKCGSMQKDCGAAQKCGPTQKSGPCQK